MAELPRHSRRMQGKPLEYTPSQLEKLKSERGQQSGIRSTEQEETSVIIHPDYEVNQPQRVGTNQEQPKILESIIVESATGELSDTQLTEPKIFEPKSKSTSFDPTSEFIA